jgi:hypothetical protein
MGAENLAPTGIGSPDRPVRSQSLYRLSYLGPYTQIYRFISHVHSVDLIGRGKKVKVTLYRPPRAQRGWMSAPRPGRFIPGKDPVPTVQEAG